MIAARRIVALGLGLLLLAGVSVGAWPEVPESWQGSGDGMLYAYSQRSVLAHQSVLNPDNRIARLPETATTAEVRGQLALERDDLRVFLRPIATAGYYRQDQACWDEQELYLSQWQARLRPTPTVSLAAGRELLNWGPGQFRSPSSPLYFDNGRSNPVRELSGVDLLKLAWTPDAHNSLLVAWLSGSGHAGAQEPPRWRGTWLAKGERRAESWAGSIVLAQQPRRETFLGAYGQWSASDAWLLYGEAGSGTVQDLLHSPPDPEQPWSLQPESPRRTSLLLGAAYTLTNGQSLSAEYLCYGHGYSRGEAAAYFARAEAAAALAPADRVHALGLALRAAPDLLGRHYLHLIWQNSLLAGEGYWRLMYSHSLDDGSGEAALYLERPLSGRLSVFLMGVLNRGGTQAEFGRLIDHGLMLGCKLAIP